MEQTELPESARSTLRMGLLVPSSNTVMEVDLYRGLPDRFTVHTARMYLEETTREAEQRMIDEFAPEAAASVGTARPHFVVFGCTSAGSLGGHRYDREICRRLSEVTGVPTVGVFSAVREALGRTKARSIAVITPYGDDLNASIRGGLEGDGFEVLAFHGLGITVNFELATVTPAEIAAFAVEKLKGVKADAVFFSCTNFRALEALPLLKGQLGMPVVTSNSATLEAILAMEKTIDSVPGSSKPPPERAELACGADVG
jgi:maleate isomerase